MQVDAWVFEEKMDFSIFDERPVYNSVSLNKRQLLKRDRSYHIDLMLMPNNIETFDNPFAQTNPSVEGSFYHVGIVQIF